MNLLKMEKVIGLKINCSNNLFIQLVVQDIKYNSSLLKKNDALVCSCRQLGGGEGIIFITSH